MWILVAKIVAADDAVIVKKFGVDLFNRARTLDDKFVEKSLGAVDGIPVDQVDLIGGIVRALITQFRHAP